MIPKFRAWLIGQEYMAEIEAIAFRGTYIAVNGKTTELLKYINEGFVIIGNIYANPELYHFPDVENMVAPR